MAAMITGTIGSGDWRISRSQRSPRHNQSVAKRNGGKPVSGAVDMALVTQKSGRRIKAKPLGRRARKTAARKASNRY